MRKHILMLSAAVLVFAGCGGITSPVPLTTGVDLHLAINDRELARMDIAVKVGEHTWVPGKDYDDMKHPDEMFGTSMGGSVLIRFDDVAVPYDVMFYRDGQTMTCNAEPLTAPESRLRVGPWGCVAYEK